MRTILVSEGFQANSSTEGTEATENPVAKDSLAYIQLEKQNERLKEALIKLRDITTETDQEQRRRISEMERDVSGVEELQASYDESVIKLANAETQIEDLKLQLDDALAAEDMLVQLTERNLMLGEASIRILNDNEPYWRCLRKFTRKSKI